MFLYIMKLLCFRICMTRVFIVTSEEFSTYKTIPGLNENEIET